MRFFGAPPEYSQARAVRPGIGAEIDWSHPLAKALQFYLSFAGYGNSIGEAPTDLVSRVTLTGRGGTTASPNINLHLGVPFAAGFSHNMTGSGSGAVGAIKGLTSVTAGVKFRTTTTLAGTFLARSVTGATGVYILNMLASGVAEWSVFDNSSTKNTVDSTVVVNDGDWYTIFGTWLDNLALVSLSVYRVAIMGATNTQLGLLESVTAAAAGGTIGETTADLAFAALTGGGSGLNSGGVEWCGIWGRALNASEMAELAENPYGFLGPVRRRYASMLFSYTKYSGGSWRKSSPVLQRPGVGAQIDWTQPLALGLRFYVPFLGDQNSLGDVGQDLVGKGLSDTRISAVTTSVNPHLGLPYASGPLARWTGSKVQAPTDIGGPITVAAKFRYTTSTGSSRWILAGKSAAAGDCYSLAVGNATVPTADQAVFRVFVGAANVIAITVNTYVDGDWYTAFGSWDGAIVRVRVFRSAGVVSGSPSLLLEDITGSATAGPISRNVLTNVAVGGSDGGGSVFTGDIEWAGIWARALDISEMQQLASDPYILLVGPETRLRFFLLGLAAALSVQQQIPAFSQQQGAGALGAVYV